MKKFNINGMIECKLSDNGEKILRNYYSRFELWFFGHVFGNSMYNGAENIVEENVIYFQEKDIR